MNAEYFNTTLKTELSKVRGSLIGSNIVLNLILQSGETLAIRTKEDGTFVKDLTIENDVLITAQRYTDAQVVRGQNTETTTFSGTRIHIPVAEIKRVEIDFDVVTVKKVEPILPPTEESNQNEVVEEVTE